MSQVETRSTPNEPRDCEIDAQKHWDEIVSGQSRNQAQYCDIVFDYPDVAKVDPYIFVE